MKQVKINKVWIDGDTLVRKVGEAEASDYLHGSGYQARLTRFIYERDKRLKEEAQAKEQRRSARLAKSSVVEPELGEE